MQNYHDLLRLTLETGTLQANRTGVRAYTIPGHMLKFDMADGFPAISTKKLAFKSMVGEYIAFLRGATSAADFRALGCNYWDANANMNQAWLANPNRRGPDDLGRIYGAQWRDWYDGALGIDQIQTCLDQIRNDPTNRRIIVSAWRPDELYTMALAPCHVLYQFLVNVERQELNLCMYQRSCDLFLGVPMNIAGSALLLHIFAAATGLKPRHFTHFLADCHVYENHVDQVNEQLSRYHFPMPSLEIKKNLTAMSADQIAACETTDFDLHGYMYHPAISAPMAV